MPTQANPNSSDHGQHTMYAIDPNNFPEILPPSATNASDEESSGSDESSDDVLESNDSPDDGLGHNKSSSNGLGDDESSNNGSKSANEPTIPLNDKGKGKQKVNLAVNDNSFVPPPDFDSNSERDLSSPIEEVQTHLAVNDSSFVPPPPPLGNEDAQSIVEMQTSRCLAQLLAPKPSATISSAIVVEFSSTKLHINVPTAEETPIVLAITPIISYTSVVDSIILESRPMNYTEQQLHQSHYKIKHTKLEDNSYLNKATTLKNLTLNQLQTQILHSNALSKIDDGIAIVENDLESLIKYNPA
ncbi:hypothetical protein JR316_0012494 [Psilocybe cubensis]|uniref:Uncharacterized protein n=2 Tax=Psilocybe cubensis TaxID=181762 RepID=A0A8H7XQ56_PSICU|nr:hypothetical protein JR316_0012494 [Psilocybe cubensis]KAH9475383.1 hypothetical protein JR316_0012494 [Psilocybe cubensis]